MMIISTIAVLAAVLFFPANLALWFFGVRPYIQKHGRTTITAANWGLSIWADLTTALEIGREEGRLPPCVKWLVALQVMAVGLFLVVLVGAIMT